MPAGGSEHEPRRLLSRDGTRLTYYAGGTEEGVPLVFCGGLGGGIQVWQPLIERFAPRFRASRRRCCSAGAWAFR